MGLLDRFRGTRVKEATQAQIATSGASGWGVPLGDPDLNELDGFRRAGSSSRREVPFWTRDRLVTHSIANYRVSPLGRAIIDTYTAFCVGDSGVRPQSDVPAVQAALDRFWNDPANAESPRAVSNASMTISNPMNETSSETAIETMVGDMSGVVRLSPVDPHQVKDVELWAGNPLWHDQLIVRDGEAQKPLQIVYRNDLTELREGQVLWLPSWHTSHFDRRGIPFMAPIIDWVDAYDQMLWNLVDRTKLARHIVFDVTLKGAEQKDIDKFIQDRGGVHAPASGTVEVHNDTVEWKPMQPALGSYEDTNTTRALMTQVAGGAGLARTWLAEPEGSNRATALTMAEPVRRRVGGVQNLWLGFMRELCAYQVDQLVARDRLPMTVDMNGRQVPTSEAFTMIGPEIAAADAQMKSAVLVNLGTGLGALVQAEILGREAAQKLAQKAYADFAGVPWDPSLDTILETAMNGDVDSAATNDEAAEMVAATEE